MLEKQRTLGNRLWQTLASVRTGIILLILVGVVAAAGTVILQRPTTENDQMQRAYSPELLRWLDQLGLTNIFHSWWFTLLLALLAISILLASIERFPAAWRYYARPYKRPEPHFRAVLPIHFEVPIRSESRGIQAAERALRKLGFQPERVVEEGETSLYAEKFRFARLAAYVVHIALLLVLLGGIVDSMWGYRGFVMLVPGQRIQTLELSNKAQKPLGFTLRCDGAGQENYADGTPKKWWSKLAVEENGREVARKEIVVNDPLVYRGLRFYQSSFGPTGQVSGVKLTATAKSGEVQEITVRPAEPVQLAGASVRLLQFVPDFYVKDNEIYTRSNDPENPAIQLAVTSQGKETKFWIFAQYPEFSHGAEDLPYNFQFKDLDMGYFTGLEVSHEPGQWLVWAGCLLMGGGLLLAFYFIHMRFWVIPISDGEGKLALWVGASPSKNREEFEERFQKVVAAIQDELKSEAAQPVVGREASLAGAAGR